MPKTDLEWGAEVLKDNQHFFLHLEEHIARMRDVTAPVESGQIWYALPEGSYVWLVGKRHDRDRKQDADWQCFAVIVEGTLRPIPDRLPGPCPWEIHFITEGPRRIDPYRKRPGLLLCEPHRQTSHSVPIRRSGRALWIRVESKTRCGYGCLRIQGASRDSPARRGCFPFWTAWGIDIAATSDDKGNVLRRGDLLFPTGDISRCVSPEVPSDELASTATRLIAEMLGIRPSPTARPRHFRRTEGTFPLRGEVVLVRFGAGEERTPCVVVSPTSFNRTHESLVVLQCVRYEAGDHAEAMLVPLPNTLLFRGRRWSVDLTLVRGFEHAHRYWCSSEPRCVLEPAVVRRIDAALKDLYA